MRKRVEIMANIANIKDFFLNEIEDLKNEEITLKDQNDSNLFTYLCLKYYFYFDSAIEDNDNSDILEAIVDGPSDGSIDALCNNWSAEENDVVCTQSKYYKTTEIDPTSIVGEISEMQKSINMLKKRKYSTFSGKVIDRYITTTDKAQTEAIEYVFFTSYVPKPKKKKKIMALINEDLNCENIQIFFGDDIKNYIEGCKEQNAYVDTGKLIIDKCENFLSYDDPDSSSSAIMVNISANSLKDLYIRMQRSLLGMNLRYYIRNKAVDSGLKNTIQNAPNYFWFYNNGIVIACNYYKIDGNELKLEKFSIINGGQTTDMIRKIDFSGDFYLPCKVIQTNMEGKEGNYVRTDDIARATNSQKPIRPKDLVANAHEQQVLKGKLKQLKVQYITKNGETILKKFKDKNYHINIDRLGKLGLSGIIQIPSSRSNSKILYDKSQGCYSQIFETEHPQIYVDLLYIDNYFKSFQSSKEASKTMNQGLTRNSRTYMLASLSFLSLITQKPDCLDLLDDLDSDPEKTIKNISKKIQELPSIIVNQLDNEDEILKNIFLEICNGSLFNAYCLYLEEDLDPSNFLKKKDSYYIILKYLRNQYIKTYDKSLKNLSDILFLKKTSYKKQ